MRHVNRNSVPSATARLLSRQEVLAIIKECDERGVPKPFAVAFCTCDESAGTGGEIIRYKKAIWHVKNGRVSQNDSFERVNATSAKPQRSKTPKSNWTLRIRGLDTDQIRQLHLDLILEFNGHSVR